MRCNIFLYYLYLCYPHNFEPWIHFFLRMGLNSSALNVVKMVGLAGWGSFNSVENIDVGHSDAAFIKYKDYSRKNTFSCTHCRLTGIHTKDISWWFIMHIMSVIHPCTHTEYIKGVVPNDEANLWGSLLKASWHKHNDYFPCKQNAAASPV